MPDRVIDAPDVNEMFLRSLSHSQLIGFVVNLRAEVARLEAEKQEARTEGWNDCVDAAAKACENQLEGDDPYKSAPDPSFNIAIETCRVAIQKLSKPTAAKQGDAS